MSLFDIFTGGAGTRAAQQSRDFLGQLFSQGNQFLGNQQNTGVAALQSGQEGALGATRPLYAQAGQTITDAAPQITGAITGYGNQGLDALRGGIAGGQNALEQALSSWDPLGAAAGRYGATATNYTNAVADALGLNGPEGVTRAQGMFTTSPAYNFNLNQGIEAINRGRAAAGQLVGGNTDRAQQEYGAGLASREYGSWMDRLQRGEGLYNPLEAQTLGQTASGRTGVLTNLANLLSGGGGQIANLLTQMGGNLANAYGGTSRSLADLLTRQAGGEANIFGQTGSNIASLLQALTGAGLQFSGNVGNQISDTYTNEANARMAGAANLTRLLSSIAGAAIGGPLGGAIGGGLGSLGSSLGSSLVPGLPGGSNFFSSNFYG